MLLVHPCQHLPHASLWPVHAQWPVDRLHGTGGRESSPYIAEALIGIVSGEHAHSRLLTVTHTSPVKNRSNHQYLYCFFFFLVFEVEASLARRFALSTRLPTPRPSRAACVGVEVEPESFFSGWGCFSVSDFFLGAVASGVVVVEDVDDVFAESCESLGDALAVSESFSDFAISAASALAECPPPLMMKPAPIPISLSSCSLPHSGHFLLTGAVIDCVNSNR